MCIVQYAVHKRLFFQSVKRPIHVTVVYVIVVVRVLLHSTHHPASAQAIFQTRKAATLNVDKKLFFSAVTVHVCVSVRVFYVFYHIYVYGIMYIFTPNCCIYKSSTASIFDYSLQSTQNMLSQAAFMCIHTPKLGIKYDFHLSQSSRYSESA